MQRKIAGVFVVYALLGASVLAQTPQERPKFSDYPAILYKGPLRIPSYYVKTGDVWRDDMGKEVAPPTINFAGKYHLGLHSCGAECRYFTLSDLSTGQDTKALDMFSSDGEKPSKTTDGRTYITGLLSHADSTMVVAQYHIDESDSHPSECRERIFVLDSNGRKLTPVTGTINGCEDH